MKTLSDKALPTVHCDHSGDPFAGGDKSCILCGKCLEVCPLFTATGREEYSPRAKFYLQQTMAGNPNKAARLSAARLAEICLSCGRCEKACPQELCAPHLAGELRAAYPDWEQWVWKKWIEKGALLWPLASAMTNPVPKALLGRRLRPMVDKLRTLTGGVGIEPWLEVTKYDQSVRNKRALVFAGCVSDYVRRGWSDKAEQILKGLGYTVPPKAEFLCCACTLGHAGLKKRQTELQRHNVDVWRRAGRPLIVAFCATCRCGLRSYAGMKDLGMDTEEAQLWLHAVKPLAGLWGETQTTALPNAPQSVYYHTPCHGSGGGWDYDLLQAALGDRLKERTTKHCCGMGGVMQLSDMGLTKQVADQLWTHLNPEPGSQVLTACSGCVTQLAATAPEGVTVGHWLEIVA